MEKMRFEEKFDYTINMDKNIDSSFVLIPLLLIQPYVENAIWHGLMQKETGKGIITINITQPEDNQL